jgi:hypothetical protein
MQSFNVKAGDIIVTTVLSSVKIVSLVGTDIQESPELLSFPYEV